MESHPHGRALARAAADAGLEPAPVADVKIVPWSDVQLANLLASIPSAADLGACFALRRRFYGLAQALASLWMGTLQELWDAGHTAPPPPTLVRELTSMDAFMALVKKLDGQKYAAAQAYFVEAAEPGGVSNECE